MKPIVWLFSAMLLLLPLAAREKPKVASRPVEVMLAAVSRDGALLSGGIGSGSLTTSGTVVVEPLARLSAAGRFEKLPCESSLVSVVSHPEGHFYRVYGVEGDQLKLVYQGGGSSC